MTINKEALEHLEENKTTETINNQIQKLGVCSSLLALPEDFTIKNLEAYNSFRDNYRFQFATKSIADFVAYCKEFDQDGAKCFINADDMRAKTFIDIGTENGPLHQDHNATLDLQMTAAYKSLLSHTQRPLTQKEAANFIDDWAENLKVTGLDGDAIPAAHASQRLCDLTIDQVKEVQSKVGDFNESMSRLEKIEARNSTLLPSLIYFEAEPFHGLATRAFNVKLSVLTGGDKPAVMLRIIKLESQQEDMGVEFKELIVDHFKDAQIKTFIGRSSRD